MDRVQLYRYYMGTTPTHRLTDVEVKTFEDGTFLQNNATNNYYGTGTSLNNNNNKNNKYSVVGFAYDSMTYDALRESLFEAFCDCRRKKRSKYECSAFEINLEENIECLAEELYGYTYKELERIIQIKK